MALHATVDDVIKVIWALQKVSSFSSSKNVEEDVTAPALTHINN